ncbi:MAG: trehalose-phosphatase [Anaerolineae bacterium]
MSIRAPGEVKTRIDTAERLQLFLDYDGTLARFAPTPAHVEPEAEVIALLTRLVEHSRIRVAVISGRRLGHVVELLPVPGLLLAGTYGVELRLPGGERVDRVAYDEIRPVLEEIKPRWKRLTAGRHGFFLEDKGWALAIHARYAAPAEADRVLGEARGMIGKAASSDLFRVLGGHKFLEIGPALAHKGRTVAYLLHQFPRSGALPLYIGDDDKDEEAFGVIQARGGIAIRVCEERCETRADGRLESPGEVRRWLAGLPGKLGGRSDQ